jgi:hypothetical protein
MAKSTGRPETQNPMTHRFRSLAVVLFLAAIPAAKAQQRAVVTDYLPPAPSTQKFWSTENKINFTILAGQITADAITTQRGLNQGLREANPLMRPLVSRGIAGQTTASALGFGAGLGTVYLLHAMRHYRAERITMRLILAGEGAIVAHNIALLR